MTYAPFREVVVYAQGGEYYIGNEDGFRLVDASGLTPVTGYALGYIPSIAQAFGYFYVVDGVTDLRRISLAAGTISEPAATAGTIPTGARLLWLYRGRLHHGRFPDDPYNVVASASGEPLNYDVGDLTQNGAYELNNTQQAGLLGDILTAAIPYGDVSCVMGMANSIALMRGDPKSGGSIDTISREVGIVSPTAWARDPDGNLYFMSRDGLYVMPGGPGGVGGLVKPLSRGRLDATLGHIDFSSTKILMTWDPGELGIKIYLVPSDATQATTAVFWEQRKNAFWADTLPAGKGPTATCAVHGTGLAGRAGALLGCWDGYLRMLDPAALDDDGTAIESIVRYAPRQFLGPFLNAKLVQSRFLLGADLPDDFNLVYKFFVGADALTATAAADTDSYTHAKTLTLGGYQSVDRERMRGACAVLQLSNNVLGKAWAIERADVLVSPSGRVRA